MNDDNAVLSGIICIAVLATSAVVFLIGVRFGFDDGVVDGKNQGIVFCMEQPKNCKISYEYLKLQENTNE
jgi:hypothetical protein